MYIEGRVESGDPIAEGQSGEGRGGESRAGQTIEVCDVAGYRRREGRGDGNGRVNRTEKG